MICYCYDEEKCKILNAAAAGTANQMEFLLPFISSFHI